MNCQPYIFLAGTQTNTYTENEGLETCLKVMPVHLCTILFQYTNATLHSSYSVIA